MLSILYDSIRFALRSVGKLTGLILFLCLVFIYNLNARFIAGSDVYCTRFMPVILCKTGDYYMPTQADETRVGEDGYLKYPALQRYETNYKWNLGTWVHDPASPSNGRVISVYPTYMPTLLYPLYLPFFHPKAKDMHWEHYLVFYLDKWISSILCALTGAMVFGLISRMHGGRIFFALLVTIGMSLGTSLWAITSQGSWAMGPSAFYMTLAIWALERGVRLMAKERSMWWCMLSGFAIASAFCMRQSDIFFVLPFFFFALWELRRSYFHIAFFCLGIFPVAAWWCVHNQIHFGSFLTSNHKYNMAWQRIHNILHIENFFAGFIGLLFSPSLGMFFTAPITLFALPGLVGILFHERGRVIERRSNGTTVREIPDMHFVQRVMRIGVPFSVFHVLFYSCYLEWWAGWSYCYRYLIDIQPFLAIAAGWFLRPGARWLALRWPLYVPALAVSLLVQVWGAFFWNGSFFYQDSAAGYNISDHSGGKRLYLDLNPKKTYQKKGAAPGSAGIPFKGPFNLPSFLYSFDTDDHIIMKELKGGLPSPQTRANAIATWDKVKRDFVENEKVNFKYSPPIILYQGEKRNPRPPG